ncbi:TonB-dependent receptor [Candidatus Falkowbacteria bacterium]|nr:TonB-dependent receptor [Candidatus Falkowbacteria bacterium]
MKSKLLLLLMLIAGFTSAWAQQKTVTGTVTDNADGTTLPGVNVLIQGTFTGTVTDVNGFYTIQAAPDDVLEFSFIGYEKQEQLVGSQSVINVALSPVTTFLDQVIVVGYGQLLKSQVVGAITKVDGGKIAREPVLTAAQALQGKSAGVQVISTGKPGDQPQVRVRGITSVTADGNPIYVVDGMITTDITNINSSDIQSMEVLKDAASQAIYGSRAGNGVILITTKSGKAGKMKVNFDSYVGFRQMTNKVKMADANLYANYTNEARAYDGQNPLFDPDTLKYNTDWFDEVSRSGLMNNYNLSISGGSDKITYYFSAGYFVDNGIIEGNDYTRYVFRLANDFKPADFIKLGYNLNINVSKNDNKPNVFDDAYRMAPTAPVQYPNGNWGYLQALSVANPVAQLHYTNDIFKQQRLLGNVYAELKPVDGLTLRSSFNFDRYNNDGTNYVPEYFIWSGQKNDISDLTISTGKGFYWIFDNNVNYTKTFALRHQINVTAGYSAEQDKYSSLYGNVKDVPDQSNLWYIGQGDLTTATSGSSGNLYTRAAVYGRATYTFSSRYTLSGSLRRDGSSNFPVNEKWGTFWSAGATWIVTQESFMENQTFFDEIKLRGSYGKIGQDNIRNLGVLTGVTILSNYYAFGGQSGTPQQAITFDQIKDAQATWEPTTGYDIGLEFLILNRRLRGDIGYYNKLSNNYVSITLPSAVGDADRTVFSQAADVRNKGVEIALNWNDKIADDFTYFVGGNITFNNNNVESVDGNLQLRGGSLGNGEIVTYTVEGEPIGSFWVYQTEGIYRTQEEIDATPHFTGTKPGDLIYADVNGDGTLSELDRVFAGSYQPKFYYGISAGINWKQLDFSVDCYGNGGNKVYNGKKGLRFGNDNIEEERAANRWSPDNPNGTEPRASNSIPKPSTYFVESGSFFRINNVTLGYTLPLTKWKMNSLRFYVTAQNPVIFTNYSGFTPELPGSNTSSGIELNIYPVTSAYLFGINVQF